MERLRARARACASEGFRVYGLGHGKTLQGPAAGISLLTGALWMTGPFGQKSVQIMLELHEWKQVSFRRLDVPRDLHRNVPDAR